MATITKRGKSYLIRCYAGYSVDGKQITKSMTYRPEPGMTPAKIKKEVQRQAVLFEESVKAGECDGKRIKFEKFAEQWLKDYAEVELAPKTVYDYRKLLPSINAYIGHLYLDDIRPKHLIQMREAIANTPAETMYVVRSILKGMLKKCGLNTYAALQQATGLCEDTISRATKKIQGIQRDRAENRGRHGDEPVRCVCEKGRKAPLRQHGTPLYASGVLCFYQGRGVAVHRQQSGCARGSAQKGQSGTARADGGGGSVYVGAPRQGTHPLPHGGDGPADDRHAAGGTLGAPVAQSGLRESTDCH